jgi:signal peptidase II
VSGATATDLRGPNRFLELAIVGLIVALDQATKRLVAAELSLHESVPIVPGLLHLVHVRNTGAAFGFLNAVDFAFKPLVIGLGATLALLGVMYYARHLPRVHVWSRIGLALILGGAVGNLIDRARQGYVVDFVDVFWKDYHFWAFNVADAAISVGVAVMILDTFRPEASDAPPRSDGASLAES